MVLKDADNNVMAAPEVPVATTLPDRLAPLLRARSPCGSAMSEDLCPATPGRKFCDNVGQTFLNMFFQVNEGGAAYFLLTKLPTNSSLAQRLECEQLQIGPGEMYEVPEGEKWRGCVPPAAARRRLRSGHFHLLASSLRGDGSTGGVAASLNEGASVSPSNLGLRRTMKAEMHESASSINYPGDLNALHLVGRISGSSRQLYRTTGSAEVTNVRTFPALHMDRYS